MPSIGSPSEIGAGAQRGGLARALRWVAAGCGFAVLAAGIGFLWFLHLVSAREIQLEGKADGIVVLTGGASRIEDAIDLLAHGRGQRLLISGVNRTTSSREIARLRPEHGRIFDCCVDLDRTSVNTATNATETRRWVAQHGFKSLIVVTSNYHMPRAMAELSHQLPDLALVAFPVVSDQLQANWMHAPTLRLLFLEYVKYMVAVARMRVPVIDRMFA